MKLVKCAKTGNIISGAAFFILGIILMIFPESSIMVLCRAAGAVILTSGIVRLAGYFSKDLYYLAFQFDFALGIFSILFGAVLIFRPSWLVSTVQMFMGIFILINGLFALQTSMDSKKFGMKYWWVLLLFSVFSSVLGFGIIINPFRSAASLVEITGITLLLVGGEKIFVSIYTIVTKKVNKDIKNAPVDLSDYKDYRERTE